MLESLNWATIGEIDLVMGKSVIAMFILTHLNQLMGDKKLFLFSGLLCSNNINQYRNKVLRERGVRKCRYLIWHFILIF